MKEAEDSSLSESNLSNTILSKEVEDSSSTFQASQAMPLVKEAEDSSSNGSSLSNTILDKEVEDFSSTFQASKANP